MLVSVVVPVYNAEKTLRRCLCSIQRQTWKDLEVIVVNDGSTDSSLDIIREFCRKDSRFRCVDKKNTGVSDSRNQGICQAGGECLQFVDSDDWIPANATQLLAEAMEKQGADMVIGDYIRVTHGSAVKKGHVPREGKLTRAEYAAYMMRAPANYYYGVMWNKLYRAVVVRENRVSCSDELDWCEDFRFNLEYLRYIQTVAVVFQPVYYYVKRKGSLVDTQVDLRTTVKTKKVLFQYYKDLYDTLDMYEDHKLRIQAFYLEFARDMERRPEKMGRTDRQAGSFYKKEYAHGQENMEGRFPRFLHIPGLPGDRSDGAILPGKRAPQRARAEGTDGPHSGGMGQSGSGQALGE